MSLGLLGTTPWQRIRGSRRGVVAIGAVGALAITGLFMLAAEEGATEPSMMEHVFRGYLIGWLFILGLALGAQAMLMIHHLTGGWWGFLLRRPAEAAGLTIPIIGLLGIPLIFGNHYVFPWADPARAGEALIKHRAPLFNPVMGGIKAVVYFVTWSITAWQLSRLSRQHDATGDPEILAKLRKVSVVGLILYFFLMSLASIDWICSREVDWYSSTFGVVTCVGQSVGGMCVLILTLAAIAKRPPMREIMDLDAVHDVGTLLFVTVVLWAYTSFAQFLVIWIGQTQDDAIWFFHRQQHGWQYVGVSLMLLHFLLPFILLLQQPIKRNVHTLALVAAGLLFMRYVDYLYMVVPSAEGRDGAMLSAFDLIIPPIMLVVWAILYLALLSKRPLHTKAREMLVASMADVDHHGHDHDEHTAASHA